MTDLVQRLRDSVTQARAVDRAALLHEAADEIERLQLTALERQVVEVASQDLRFPDDRVTLELLLERTKPTEVK